MYFPVMSSAVSPALHVPFLSHALSVPCRHSPAEHCRTSDKIIKKPCLRTHTYHLPDGNGIGYVCPAAFTVIHPQSAALRII